MIRHVFLMRLATGVRPAEVIGLLNGIPENVPGIKTWSVGAHAGADEGNAGWDCALVCDFNSLADLEAYGEHPNHLAVVRAVSPLLSARAVCDFEF